MVAAVTTAGAAPPTQASTRSAGAGGSAVQPSLVAGYVAAPVGGLASASVRFKLPTVKCSGGDEAATVGLGDVHDLESPRVRAHAILTCLTSGSAEYSLAVQACSQSAGPLASKRKHRVSVTLAQSGGTVTVTVTDEKAGTTISATDSTANCAPAGPIDALLFGAFPVFDPDLLDVPEFNKVKSRDATLNGGDLSGERLHRQTEPGIKTSKLGKELSSSVSASRRSGDSYSLLYRGVVHCCLEPTPTSEERRTAM
jgi:hypothetical protein